MKIMASACLVGEDVKYNGGNNRHQKVLDYIKENTEWEPDKDADLAQNIETAREAGVYLVCPELMGGLTVPRFPGEIVHGEGMAPEGEVQNANGNSVDYEYRIGAQLAYQIAAHEKIDVAILQSRSPSCGVNQIYDGTFTGTLIEGSGVFAQLLKEGGFKVIDAEDL